MKKSIALAFLALAVAATSLLCGCNTVNGIGQDIGKAGHAIQRAANK